MSNTVTVIKLLPTLNALKLPNLNPVYREAFSMADKVGLWNEYGITTKLRIAWFLAQILHESGGLRSIRENMNYSVANITKIFGVNKHSASVTPAEAARLAGKPEALAERVYGLGNPRKAKELGNSRPGDGWKFRGGGPLQNTGGDAFMRYGKRMGIDLYGNPDLISDPRYTLIPTLMFWKDRGCNSYADANDGVKLTRAINGGTNGYTDRITWFNKIWRLLAQTGIVSAPASTEVHEQNPQSNKNPGEAASAWEVAVVSEETRKLQKDLNELGAEPRLKEDGRFGPNTEKAVRAYQAANNLDVDGIPGDVTLASIKTRLATMGTTTPTAVSEKPAGTTNEVTGGTLLGTGVSLDVAISKFQTLKDMLGDNKYVQIAIAVVVVAGIALIIYSQVRKYLWRNTTLVE